MTNVLDHSAKNNDRGKKQTRAGRRSEPLISPLALSVVIAIFIHLALWFIAGKVQVRAFYATITAPVPERRMQVKSIDLRQLLARRPKPRPPLRKQLIKKQQHALEKLFEKENLLPKPRHILKPELTGLGRERPPAIPRHTVLPPLAAETSPPPEIVAIKARDLPISRQLLNRPRIPVIARVPLVGERVPSLVSLTPGAAPALRETIPLGMRMRLPPRPLPGSEMDSANATILMPPGDAPEHAGALGEDQRIQSLDAFLDVRLQAWREADGGGYFKLEIRPNEKGGKLKPIPKDILFLLDSSASITSRKLKQFRDGLLQALGYLGPGDRYNVVSFRAHPQPLFSSFAAPLPRNLELTRKFLSRLRATGKTDVFAGLVPYISVKRLSDRPLMIFLISDGKTTTGHQIENDEFLRRISQENRSGASIFSFSCGKNTNFFLMNFIAYLNRGVSEYQERTEFASRGLSHQIGGFSELLVADISCKITGDLQQDVYPRHLPNLFRGYPLIVYGRFRQGDDEIAVQLLGRDQAGRRRELVIHRKLSEAAAGGPDLAASWAGQKLVYLIAEQAVRPSPERAQEIRAIQKRFHIMIPYKGY